MTTHEIIRGGAPSYNAPKEERHAYFTKTRGIDVEEHREFIDPQHFDYDSVDNPHSIPRAGRRRYLSATDLINSEHDDTVFLNGLEMRGFSGGYRGEIGLNEPPEWVTGIRATAMVLSNHPGRLNAKYNGNSGNVATTTDMLSDLKRAYGLKRIPAKDKDMVRDRMYADIMEWATTPHQMARIIIEVFRGVRKADYDYDSTPHKPAIGTLSDLEHKLGVLNYFRERGGHGTLHMSDLLEGSSMDPKVLHGLKMVKHIMQTVARARVYDAITSYVEHEIRLCDAHKVPRAINLRWTAMQRGVYFARGRTEYLDIGAPVLSGKYRTAYTDSQLLCMHEAIIDDWDLGPYENNPDVIEFVEEAKVAMIKRMNERMKRNG